MKRILLLIIWCISISPQVYAQTSEKGKVDTRFIANTIASVGVAYGAKTALKAIINEERPDHSDNKSFPSGHAAMSFAAARSLDKEFRKTSIWIPIAGYAAATAVGIERVASDRHHWYDVVAGAAVGIGSAELTWWLSDKLFGKGRRLAVGTTGNTVDISYNF
jgi:membrane-associated phospholipid phosphatase